MRQGGRLSMWTPIPQGSTGVLSTCLPQLLDCDPVPASGRAAEIQGLYWPGSTAVGYRMDQFPINGLPLDGSPPSDLARELP